MKDKEIEELIDDMIDLAEEGILYTPDYFKTKYKMDEQLSKIKDNKTALLAKFRELEQQVERLKCCGNCYNQEDYVYCKLLHIVLPHKNCDKWEATKC